MNLVDALKAGNGMARRQYYNDAYRGTVEITTDGSRSSAYLPLAPSDSDRIAINMRLATASEIDGHEDWEPFNVVFKPPQARCASCGTADVSANLICRRCGTKGCFNCIDIESLQCRRCINSQVY